MHPIHHAVIHIVDTTNRPEDGLDSALKCGPHEPSIGHMWHMPTHLYYALARGPGGGLVHGSVDPHRTRPHDARPHPA